jgi:predicted nucleic acid-binding protein
MTMLGLDTSVVVRLLVGLPEGQAARAKRRLEEAMDEGETILVTDLAIGEAYHALHHHYEVPKPEARELLRRFVSSGVVLLLPETSLQALAPSGGAGLMDRLIHARHRAEGAVTLTFERRQSRLEGAEALDTR